MSAAFEEGANTKYPDDLAEPGTLGAGEPCRKSPRSGNDERLLDARSLNFSQPAADDVEITGARTREERDAEGRKRAIDLESNEERKRAKTALEERVAKARSVCDASWTSVGR